MMYEVGEAFGIIVALAQAASSVAVVVILWHMYQWMKEED